MSQDGRCRKASSAATAPFQAPGLKGEATGQSPRQQRQQQQKQRGKAEVQTDLRFHWPQAPRR
eukprot:8466379-Alexandrium_andersonii.AAC.1